MTVVELILESSEGESLQGVLLMKLKEAIRSPKVSRNGEQM